MDDLISRQDAITIPILPKEHRKYQTMNLDDAYELGWIDCQGCIENLPSAERHEQITSEMNEIFRIASEIRLAVGCNTLRECWGLARKGDIQRVRHGKWIMHINDLFPMESTMECDQCHEEQPLECDDKYCPNCGAKMDEVE